VILFDIYHLPQWNFLKNTINATPENERIVCCVDRSRLRSIIDAELEGGSVNCFGSYKYNFNFLSMIMLIIVPRIVWLMWMIRKHKVKFVVSANYQSNLAAKFFSTRNIVFNDDPRKGVIQLAKFAADRVYVTKGFSIEGTSTLNCLKEWAYLNPKYFTPDLKALQHYGVEPFSYIMGREVSTNTTNYYDQETDQLIHCECPSNERILISLEDKSKRDLLKDNWTLLQEPIKDIHSLMFFSKGFLSTGDSMAREAAELGVPAYYAGARNMIANQILIDMGLMKHASAQSALSEIASLEIDDVEKEIARREEVRNRIANEWDDVNKIIEKEIEYNR